jgi:hypothetical protein
MAPLAAVADLRWRDETRDTPNVSPAIGHRMQCGRHIKTCFSSIWMLLSWKNDGLGNFPSLSGYKSTPMVSRFWMPLASFPLCAAPPDVGLASSVLAMSRGITVFFSHLMLF